MSINFIYTIAIIMGLSIYLALSVNIFVVLLLVFSVNKVVQLELYGTKNKLLRIIEKNPPTYAFMGDIVFMAYLWSNNLLTKDIVFFYYVLNFYIYYSLFDNLEINKRIKSKIVKGKELLVARREVNGMVVMSSLPIYYSLLMGSEQKSLEGILFYSWLFFAGVVIIDYLLKKQKMNTIESNRYEQSIKNYINIKNERTMEGFNRYKSFLESRKESLLIIVTENIIHQPVDFKDFLVINVDLKDNKDLKEILIKNDVKNIVFDKEEETEEGLGTILINQKENLVKEIKYDDYRNYCKILVSGQYIRDKFLNSGIDPDRVVIVGKEEVARGKSGDGLVIYPTKNDSMLANKILMLIKRNKQWILDNKVKITIDISRMNISEDTFFGENESLKEEIIKINAEIQKQEMDKEVSFKDLFNINFYENYNGNMINIDRSVQAIENKFKNYKMIITDSDAPLIDIVSMGIKCCVVGEGDLSEILKISGVSELEGDLLVDTTYEDVEELKNNNYISKMTEDSFNDALDETNMS